MAFLTRQFIPRLYTTLCSSKTTLKNVVPCSRLHGLSHSNCQTQKINHSHLNQTTVWGGMLQTRLGAGLYQNEWIQKRWYMRRKTMKIPPTKPLNFDYGGDLIKTDYPIDLKKPKLELLGAEGLDEMNEVTKKLMSLEFGDGQAKLQRRIHDLVSKVQEHPLDVGSLEVKIAYETVAVRNQMRHVLKFRKDKVSKSQLVQRLQARRKHMKQLRALDYEKFLWLCDQLQIRFIPVPQYNRKPSKRALVKKTARDAAISTIKDKSAKFKDKLEEEKKRFFEYKEQELSDILQKLETLKLEESSYLWKVHRALKHGEVELLDENPEPLPSRRKMILRRKFALAEQRKKEREAAQSGQS